MLKPFRTHQPQPFLVPGDTLTALRVLNRERGSSVLSSNGVSVELDQFIGPRDCEDILQRTINKIKSEGY